MSLNLSSTTKFNGNLGYKVGIVLISLILGFVTVVNAYRGFTTGANVYFQIAQAYGGITIAIFSFLFIDSMPKFHPRKFLAFQGLFVVGTALVAPYIQSGTPFSTTTSFEVGSFALIVMGFFITNIKEEYHNVLLYSITATTALFIAGMLSAFRDVAGVAAPSTGIGAITTYVITALFLIGAIDLTILSTLLFRVVVVKIRREV